MSEYEWYVEPFDASTAYELKERLEQLDEKGWEILTVVARRDDAVLIVCRRQRRT
jgi:hypothetical protein